jgi:hypothetical protein
MLKAKLDNIPDSTAGPLNTFLAVENGRTGRKKFRLYTNQGKMRLTSSFTAALKVYRYPELHCPPLNTQDTVQKCITTYVPHTKSHLHPQTAQPSHFLSTSSWSKPSQSILPNSRPRSLQMPHTRIFQLSGHLLELVEAGNRGNEALQGARDRKIGRRGQKTEERKIRANSIS